MEEYLRLHPAPPAGGLRASALLTLGALALVACRQETPAPKPQKPAAQATASRMELGAQDLQLKLEDHSLTGPDRALEADPVGALRPSWQLLAPSFTGLEDKNAQGDFAFGFCATLKEERWYARCDGRADQQPARVQVSAQPRGDQGGWTFTLEGQVELEDWRSQKSHIKLKTVHSVNARPSDLNPEPWWRAVGRALTKDWIDRVDKARGGSSPTWLRWAEPRHDPPSYQAPQARHDAAFAQRAHAWHVMSDQDLVYLHRFSSRSIPTAQVLQVGQSAQATPPRAALNHDGKKLLLVTQGARELDPTRDEGRDALTPLKATCQGQPVSCYGVTLLSVDAKGRILLAGRALEATAQGAPLSHADDSVLLPVKNARGVTELVHFARGGLVKNRWTLPAHSTTGDLPTTWVDPHTVAVGPLLIKGQARLLRLDTREANNKPRLSQPLAGAPLGANLLPDGEGGVLVITAQEGQAPLLHTRLGPQGEELWRRPLPGPGQAATQSLRGDQLWVHSQAPQGAGWSALLTLSTGEALYKGGQANAAPLWLPQGQLVACLPEGLRWLDAKGAQKADLKLSWGCGALASVEGGDLLVASGPPGGAYRLSPPAQWSTP